MGREQDVGRGVKRRRGSGEEAEQEEGAAMGDREAAEATLMLSCRAVLDAGGAKEGPEGLQG